jgi:predicted transcriptional regulator
LAITSDTVQVLVILSDPKACQILETTYVANEDGVEGHIIANHANLSPSGFCRLTLSLREKNMIEKKNERYFITFLGKAVYNARRILQKAIDNYHKLYVIDLLEEQHQIPEPELKRIIEICIDDHQLKDILTTRRMDS